MYCIFPGDTLTVTDGMTDDLTDLCVTAQDQVWFSAGSIVAIAFTSSMEGHGFSFAYQSLPQNKSVSGKNAYISNDHKLFHKINIP